MKLTVIEMGKDIVVTAVDHELDAYCVFSKLSANRDHDAFIVITKWFVSRHFRGRGIGRELFRAAVREAKTRYPGLFIHIIIPPLDESMNYSRLVKFFSNENFLVSAVDNVASLIN